MSKANKPKWLDRTLVVLSQYFTLCTNEKQFKQILKHLNIPKDQHPPFLSDWHCSATVHYFEHREDMKKSAVVCLGSTKGKSLIQIHALLVHEAVHIWQQTKDDYGEKNPSPEFEAYSIQSITQQLLTEFYRQTKEK